MEELSSAAEAPRVSSALQVFDSQWTQPKICSVQKGQADKDPLLKPPGLFQETEYDRPWPGGILVGGGGSKRATCLMPRRGSLSGLSRGSFTLLVCEWWLMA